MHATHTHTAPLHKAPPPDAPDPRSRYQFTYTLVAPVQLIAETFRWSVELTLDYVAWFDAIMVEGAWWYAVPTTSHWWGQSGGPPGYPKGPPAA